MALIHPTAVIAPGARIADNVEIGAYCVIGEEGGRWAFEVSLKSHVVVDGRTAISERTRIFPFASIGFETQDLKYKGEPSSLEIGHDNPAIREHVTINPGTEGGGMVTRVSNHCLLDGRRACRARLPGQRPHSPRQQRHARWARRDGGAFDPRRALGGAPIREDRPAADDRKPGAVGGRARRHPRPTLRPLWATGRGSTRREQYHRDAAAGLQPRRRARTLRSAYNYLFGDDGTLARARSMWWPSGLAAPRRSTTQSPLSARIRAARSTASLKGRMADSAGTAPVVSPGTLGIVAGGGGAAAPRDRELPGRRTSRFFVLALEGEADPSMLSRGCACLVPHAGPRRPA